MTIPDGKVDIMHMVRTHADSRLKFDLLLFWSKYPEARFTCGVVSRAVRCRRRVDVEEALESMTEANLLERHSQKGLSLYCLTRDPYWRQCVLELPGHIAGARHNWYLSVRRTQSCN